MEGPPGWLEGVLGEKGEFPEEIQALLDAEEESLDLNSNFWGKHTDIPSMATATEKEDVLRIVDNFALIKRRHPGLFQRLKVAVLKDMQSWSAPELAVLCQAWAQVSFLHEDLCVAMAPRVTATANTCNPRELVFLLDAYATVRCSMDSAISELVLQAVLRSEEFSMPQLCLFGASLASLGVDAPVFFDAVEERLLNPEAPHVPFDEDDTEALCARHVAMLAFALGRAGRHREVVWDALATKASTVAHSLTVQDLQAVCVGFAQARQGGGGFVSELAHLASRRIAQYPPESLGLTLLSVANANQASSLGGAHLFARAAMNLPRLGHAHKPSDLLLIARAFATAGIRSAALLDAIVPVAMEKAAHFTEPEWDAFATACAAIGLETDLGAVFPAACAGA